MERAIGQERAKSKTVVVGGASIYDVRKMFRFFYPLSPCHMKKSADFVAFVCFLGALLLSPHRLRTSYMEAPFQEIDQSALSLNSCKSLLQGNTRTDADALFRLRFRGKFIAH